MKHVFILLLIVALGCGESEKSAAQGKAVQQEQPGKIKGLGDVPGIPEGEILALPSWLKIDGEIIGCDEGERGDECQYDGTGGEWVSVKFKLKSTRPRDASWVIPEGATVVAADPGEGMLVLSSGDEWQHGVIVERYSMTMLASRNSGGGSSCEIKVLFYCLNKGKKGSENGRIYRFGPVLSSPLIKELIDLLKNKKNKFSDFDGSEPNDMSYGDVTREVQEIIYHITNGKGLTQQDRAYIASIPNKKSSN